MLLFPFGVTHYLIGGILIGLGVLLLFILIGSPVGASTPFAALLSFVSKLPFFRDTRLVAMRKSRLLFAFGFILGGLLYALLSNNWFTTTVSPLRLLLGGLFVGFGVRMGRGCTSGHGICGLGSRSIPSLIAVIIFTVVAIITANVLAYLGWLL